MKKVLVMVAALLGAGQVAAAALYAEPWRPQFHFTPLRQWMNDPNGLVYYRGAYHLFYQHHPAASVWGPMHWGHAVSTDLLHWEQRPVALRPDEKGTIFSGSAVVDWRNSSGLGRKDAPPMVAIFTYHDAEAEKAGREDFQSQALAYSRDAGRSWHKYAGNPVLPNPGEAAFRDPKVFWFEPSGKWIMALAAGERVMFYSSPDLKDWTLESEFGRGLGAHGGVWECPDLIQLPVENGRGTRYVLLVSVISGGPNGGSATQYFVGEFDGTRFRPDPDPAQPADVGESGQWAGGARWLDYGADNYAGVTWSGVPDDDGRTLFIGWMSNWDYALVVPTERWRGAMTLPRSLHLRRTPRGFRVDSRPVRELGALRAASEERRNVRVEETVALERLLGAVPDLHELELELDTGAARELSLAWANALGETVTLSLDIDAARLVLDRSRSGQVDFADGFGSRQVAPLPRSGGQIQLQVFVDSSSIEIFVNGGQTVMTALLFPTRPYDSLRLSSDSPVLLESASLHRLRSIWSDPAD